MLRYRTSFLFSGLNLAAFRTRRVYLSRFVKLFRRKTRKLTDLDLMAADGFFPQDSVVIEVSGLCANPVYREVGGPLPSYFRRRRD